MLVRILVVERFVCLNITCHKAGIKIPSISRPNISIMTPDLPIPTRNLNASVQPEFLNRKCL